MATQPPKIRVFIVEDSPAFVLAMADLLADIGGIEVIGSAGEAGIAAEEIMRLKPDVVTLDIQLKAGTGLEVLKRVKAIRNEAPVAIVFSNLMEEGVRRACSKLGADFVFDKFDDFELLADVLRNMTGVRTVFQAPAAG